MKISLKIFLYKFSKEKKKSIDNTNNNIFTRMESGAKIPSENENIVSSERLISKSYIFEDNQYKNIKV